MASLSKSSSVYLIEKSFRSDSALLKSAMTASCSSVFRLQALSAPGVLLKIFPQDKWKSAISFRHPINTSCKTRHNWAPRAQFYYSFLSLSSIASSLRCQVIIVFCTLEWHKPVLWGKNQLAGCPWLPSSPGQDTHTVTNACKKISKVCISKFNSDERRFKTFYWLSLVDIGISWWVSDEELCVKTSLYESP